MNWWTKSVSQRRMERSGTTPRATARSKISRMARSKISRMTRIAPLVPHPGRGRALVGGVRAGGGGHAAHAVAYEEPHPHVGVAGPAEGRVVQALVLVGGAVYDRGRHADKRGVP
jgi:hypothetical protein